MVAATSFAALPVAGDLAIVRELGSLLLSRSLIERRRWRAHATARLVPVFAHYNLPLDPLREELRDATGIVCPEPLQPVLAALLDGELARERPRLAVLARVVAARFRPDWAGAAFTGMAAALHAEAYERIAELQTLVPLTFHGRMRAYAVSGAIARHGEHGAWGSFDGNLDRVGSESAFPASPSLVLAFARHAIEQRRADRIDDLERVVAQLGTLDRARGGVHVARVVMATAGERAAAIRLRALRDDSVRDAGWYLLARDAGDVDQARRFAAQIRNRILQQRARLAIAWQLLRAGEPLRARRELANVVDQAFELEHWRLRSTIALRLRPVASRGIRWPRTDGADVPPAWFGETVIDPVVRARMVFGVDLLRSFEAGPCHHLGPGQLQHAVRRELIELLQHTGDDILSCVSRLRELERSQPADVLCAEWIAARAEALLAKPAALPAQFRRGVDGERPPTTQASLRRRQAAEARHARDNIDAETVLELLGGGAGGPHAPVPALSREAECPPAAERRIALEEQRSLERAIYDEGTTYSAPRRLGIVTAARACITGALEQPGDWDPELVTCRIRTLGLLGGQLARDVLESAALRSTGRYTLAMIETLCAMDPTVAARVAIARATRPSDQVDDRASLALVETYRGLPRGFTRSWCATHAALAKRRGERRARGWLAELVALRGLPSGELLDWLTARAEAEELADARSVLGLAEEQCDALLHEWPSDAARKLADDGVLRETLQLLRGVKVATRARPWGDVEWTRILRRAASVQTGVVDRGVVRRCARRLGCTDHALAVGDLWSLGAVREELVDLSSRLRLRVRLLGKRTDLLAYLRFADVPIANCYRSDSPLYPSTSQGDLLAVWKDPLSLCFRIERLDGRPFGFVFGGFAELATGALAVVLNGLYLARQRLDARTAVLRAIERMLCAPLGIRHVGVGNQFAGSGPFPADYKYKSVTGTRLRALRMKGELVTDSWDDISYDVNVPISLALWWRAL